LVSSATGIPKDRDFKTISIGFSRVVDCELMIEIWDFCSSASLLVGAGDLLTADCVISESGLLNSRWDREEASGEAEGEGVGSEDSSAAGVAESRLLRELAALFLFCAA
jgi:hypothetical protein